MRGLYVIAVASLAAVQPIFHHTQYHPILRILNKRQLKQSSPHFLLNRYQYNLFLIPMLFIFDES
jgi:hypothetical protein